MINVLVARPAWQPQSRHARHCLWKGQRDTLLGMPGMAPPSHKDSCQRRQATVEHVVQVLLMFFPNSEA